MTTFPTTIDTTLTPIAGQPLNNPSMTGLVTFLNSAVVALETKIGVDGSAVVTTIDYLLKNSSSINPGHKHTIASLTLSKSDIGLGNVDNTSDVTKLAATASLTNKTISDSSNTIQLGGASVNGSGATSGQALGYNGSNWTPFNVALPKFGGTGSDGALTITSGTTTIDCANASFVVKNYTSISITGTGKLAFTNPHANGTTVVLKSQGAVTLTSSQTPMIDMSSMGAAGAAAQGSIANGIAGTAGIYGNISFGGGLGGTLSGAVGGVPGVLSLTYANYASFKEILAKYPYGIIGGGGGSSANGGAATMAAGGRGGGCLIIECGGAWNFTTTSGISVSGQAGLNGTNGSGSGGGGGSFICFYNSLTANSGTVTVSGGIGGTISGSNANTGSGAGGTSTVGGTVGTNSSSVGVAGAVGFALIASNTDFS